MAAAIEVDPASVAEFCRKWKISEFALFGSVLRPGFGRDVDLVEKSGLRNPFRRHEILTTREIVYEA